jgi:hypothetical protein
MPELCAVAGVYSRTTKSNAIMRGFRMMEVEAMCKTAGVDYNPNAGYQFTHGSQTYVHLADLPAWCSEYKLGIEDFDRLCYLHKDVASNVQASTDYANKVCEELECEIGCEVDYDLIEGVLIFQTDTLTADMIEACEVLGTIEAVNPIDDNTLMVVIKSL